MLGRLFALVLICVCTCPARAAADWILSPYLGARFGANTNLLVGREGTFETNKFTFGSSIGLLTDGVLGAEADVGFVPGFFEGAPTDSSAVTTIMGNVILTTPLDLSRYGLRPYFIGGVGLMRARRDQEGLGDVVNSNLFALDIGGGAIGPLSPRTSVRFDLRYFHNISDDSEARTVNPAARLALSFWRGTVGLTFRF